jgi:hypothetical protein
VTFAVKVTGLETKAGFAEETTITAGVALFTVNVTEDVAVV